VNATFKTVMLWMSLLVVVFLAWHFAQFQKKETPVKFSEFMAQVEAGQVADVTITGNEIKGHFASREAFRTFAPVGYDKLVDTLLTKQVIVNYQPDQTPTWANMLISWAPFLLLIGFWIFFMRQMQSGGNKALSFGKSKAKLLASQQKKVTFKDVAGVDEAKEELQEIIEFLREPQKFQKLGGRIPKGVILIGPPGTGRLFWLAPSRAKPTYLSSRFPDRTSSRCSWESVPLEFATFSNRARRTPPASSSSTRSTPLAGTEVRVWAAATMSASRPSTSCSSRWTVLAATRASS
jgi:hypothetical protein